MIRQEKREMKKINSFSDIDCNLDEPQVLDDTVFFTKKALIESLNGVMEQSGIDMFRSYMNGDATATDLVQWENWKNNNGIVQFSNYFSYFNS